MSSPWPFSAPARRRVNVSAFGVPFDAASDTLDLTATVNVLDADGNDADGCEGEDGDGAVLSYKLWVVDENPEKFVVYPHIKSYNDCPAGEYIMEIDVHYVALGKTLTLKTRFTLE